MKLQSFPMRGRGSQRTGTALVQVLAVIVVLLVVGASIILNISSSREAARRDSCIHNGKRIALALQNYHDIHRRLPNSTSTRVHNVRPGAESPEDVGLAAGYGWQVMILPFIEESALFNRITDASEQFKRPAFGTVVNNAVKDCVLDCYRCPAYTGPTYAGAPEYANKNIAMSNYVATSATDLARMMAKQTEASGANGCLVPAGQRITFKSITDGTSRTFIWAETRETNYTSWYDGTVGWIVGADPNGPPPSLNADGWIVANGGMTINLGPAKNGRVYLPSSLHGSIAQNWNWGPSSEHSGGAVIHGVADGAVRTISDDIDASAYLRIITRAAHDAYGLPE
jgi:type II secretory pathway pseudopilin PulG